MFARRAFFALVAVLAVSMLAAAGSAGLPAHAKMILRRREAPTDAAASQESVDMARRTEDTSGIYGRSSSHKPHIVPAGLGFKEGDGTYYTPSLGSCGIHSSKHDMVVAVSHEMYDSKSKGDNPNKNPLCGKMIFAFYEGKAVLAKIVDRCTGCSKEDVDFSPAAFKKLGSQNTGRLKGVKWHFLDILV